MPEVAAASAASASQPVPPTAADAPALLAEARAADARGDDAAALAALDRLLNLPAAPTSRWLEPRMAHHALGGFRERYRPMREGGRTIWRLHGTFESAGGNDDASLLAAGHPVFTLLHPDLNHPKPTALRRLVEGR